MKLTDYVYLIGGSAYGYSAFGDCNLYLVDCGEALVMIDAGGGGGIPKVIENIRQMELDPKKLEIAFITHCHFDHSGGNLALKKSTGCKIAAHEAEAEEIESPGELSLYSRAKERGLEYEPTKVDIILKDGQRLKVGEVEFEVIHTPGHTPGGICLLIEENGVPSLFTGDTASAQGRFGWMNGPGCSLPDWKASIKKLIELRPERMFPGHGVFVLSGALEHLMLLDEKINAPWTTIITEIG